MGRIEEDLLGAGTEPARLVETHISWVFLYQRDVLKVKKPVDLGFLDFTTIEKRKEACEAEVRLNRRLSEGVYLGVVPVNRDRDGLHRIGGPGATVDWAVHMRRLSDAHRADQRPIDASHLESLARKLALFHGASPPVREQGGADTVRFNLEENFEQTRDFLPKYLSLPQILEVRERQRRFLQENEARFEERIEKGRVRDGHGDLRLEHVYIDEAGGIDIIDCVEFNERFRVADVCADVVFLAMDLAFHGRVDLAERFLALYARESNDYDLFPLVDFYESYRAFVRGKIAGLTGKDDEARRYFLLALASERRSLLPPSLVAVGGVIGAGKSSLADRIGAMMGAPVIDTDRTRKHLAGLEPETSARAKVGEGIYGPELTERTYREVLRRAGAVLDSRRPAVLDGSFPTSRLRSEARELARDRGLPFFFVECRAPEEVLRGRLERREAERGVSDGRLEIFEELRARFEEVTELPAAEHLSIDTSLPFGKSEEILREKLPVWPRRFTG